MKTKLRPVSFAVMVLLLGGCQSAATEKAFPEGMVQMTSLVKADTSIIRQLVSQNVHIDFDIKELSNRVMANEIGAEEMAKARVAIHRFYSHVSIVDGRYVCSLKSASEINISERVFDGMLDNLNELNEFADKCRKKGEKYTMGQITEDYLNSLLR